MLDKGVCCTFSSPHIHTVVYACMAYAVIVAICIGNVATQVFKILLKYDSYWYSSLQHRSAK